MLTKTKLQNFALTGLWARLLAVVAMVFLGTSFLSACSSSVVKVDRSSFPLWYQQRALTPANQVDGYGAGESLAAARSAALADLAQQLKTRIQSEVQTSQTQTTIGGKESVNSWAKVQTQMSSDLVLTDYTVQKTQQVGAEFYIWLRYDNRDLASRIRANPPTCNSATPLWVDLPVSRLLKGCAWELRRRNGLWYLSVQDSGGEKQWAVHAGDIEAFFFTDLVNTKAATGQAVEWVSKPEAAAAALPADLREGTYYFMRVQPVLPALQVTLPQTALFQINQLGQVARLPLEIKDKTVFFPNPKEYDGLVAESNFAEKIVALCDFEWVSSLF